MFRKASSVSHEIVQVFDHFTKPINAHHFLIGRCAVRVKVDADNIDAATQQTIERCAVGQKFGPQVYAAHTCFFGSAHDSIEFSMQQRITQAAEREDAIARLSDLIEDALRQIE